MAEIGGESQGAAETPTVGAVTTHLQQSISDALGALANHASEQELQDAGTIARTTPLQEVITRHGSLVVNINVGGTLFATTFATLAKEPNSIIFHAAVAHLRSRGHLELPNTQSSDESPPFARRRGEHGHEMARQRSPDSTAAAATPTEMASPTSQTAPSSLERPSHAEDRKGNLLFDTDPAAFAVILNMLRGYANPIPADLEDTVCCDATHYGLHATLRRYRPQRILAQFQGGGITNGGRVFSSLEISSVVGSWHTHGVTSTSFLIEKDDCVVIGVASTEAVLSDGGLQEGTPTAEIPSSALHGQRGSTGMQSTSSNVVFVPTPTIVDKRMFTPVPREAADETLLLGTTSYACNGIITARTDPIYQSVDTQAPYGTNDIVTVTIDREKNRITYALRGQVVRIIPVLTTSPLAVAVFLRGNSQVKVIDPDHQSSPTAPAA